MQVTILSTNCWRTILRSYDTEGIREAPASICHCIASRYRYTGKCRCHGVCLSGWTRNDKSFKVQSDLSKNFGLSTEAHNILFEQDLLDKYWSSLSRFSNYNYPLHYRRIQNRCYFEKTSLRSSGQLGKETRL